MTSIVHLSDLHFDAPQWNTLPFRNVEQHLIDFISELDEQPFIILSGDITFKGSERGYERGSAFFERLVGRCNIPRKNLITCPGNHDIVTATPSTPFRAFDAFSYAIRRDSTFSFSRNNCSSIEIDGVYFLVINSAFHGNPAYGLIDIDSVVGHLSSHPPSSDDIIRIAVSHHHVIPTLHHDVSATRNAYELISILDRERFSCLLHGHQHVSRGVPIGDLPTKIFGVSSFNFGSVGTLNGLNLYGVSGKQISHERYALIVDGATNERPGFASVRIKEKKS